MSQTEVQVKNLSLPVEKQKQACNYKTGQQQQQLPARAQQHSCCNKNCSKNCSNNALGAGDEVQNLANGWHLLRHTAHLQNGLKTIHHSRHCLKITESPASGVPQQGSAKIVPAIIVQNHSWLYNGTLDMLHGVFDYDLRIFIPTNELCNIDLSGVCNACFCHKSNMALIAAQKPHQLSSKAQGRHAAMNNPEEFADSVCMPVSKYNMKGTSAQPQ